MKNINKDRLDRQREARYWIVREAILGAHHFMARSELSIVRPKGLNQEEIEESIEEITWKIAGMMLEVMKMEDLASISRGVGR